MTGLFLIRKGHLYPSIALGAMISLIVVVSVFMLVYITIAVALKSKVNTQPQKIMYSVNDVSFVAISTGFISYILFL
jgi:hypothetical protein